MSVFHNNITRGYRKKPDGFVLLLTLVLLIVLSTLGYILSGKLLESRSRNQYLIDYTQARYACDSGIKYALATIEQIKPALISRPNEPDFSDLFNLTEQEYQNFLAEWAQRQSQEKDSTGEQAEDFTDTANANNVNSSLSQSSSADANDANKTTDVNNYFGLLLSGFNTTDANALVVRGPYGFKWPLIFAPVEFEIGTAKVTIEVEDENAKYPLALALLGDEKVIREAQAGFQTFMRWMWNRIESDDTIDDNIQTLQAQLDQIKEIKQFATSFEPKAISEQQYQPSATTSAQKSTAASKKSGIVSSKAGPKTTTSDVKTVRTVLTPSDQLNRQSADFAQIFHSSLIDLDLLARPTIESAERKESALKYMSLWATTKVNINTAPRCVLEAVFVFGGKEKEIADEIIIKRRIKPFKTIDDFKKELFSYSDSIEKCKDYISTASTVFTIKITAVSGVAKQTVMIAVNTEGGTTKRIALITS
jgi:DNA uptake protein ComE-like DNA-binding protein